MFSTGGAPQNESRAFLSLSLSAGLERPALQNDSSAIDWRHEGLHRAWTDGGSATTLLPTREPKSFRNELGTRLVPVGAGGRRQAFACSRAPVVAAR